MMRGWTWTYMLLLRVCYKRTSCATKHSFASIANHMQEAPVKNTRMFHDRIQELLTKHIRPGTGKAGLLGRVNHYFIRYEV